MMNSNELELIKELTQKLESINIDYMLTGSLALAFYSQPRMTRDIDIVVNISSSDIDNVMQTFKDDYYIDHESVLMAIKNKRLFNIISNEAVIKVDFIILKSEPYRIEEFSRKIVKHIDNVPVKIVAPEDLLISKLVWAKDSESTLQLNDVLSLLNSDTTLDMDYIQKWATSLEVTSLLEKVLNHG